MYASHMLGPLPPSFAAPSYYTYIRGRNIRKRCKVRLKCERFFDKNKENINLVSRGCCPKNEACGKTASIQRKNFHNRWLLLRKTNRWECGKSEEHQQNKPFAFHLQWWTLFLLNAQMLRINVPLHNGRKLYKYYKYIIIKKLLKSSWNFIHENKIFDKFKL